MKKYIGIDLGGTNVRAAIVDEEGKVLETVTAPSYAQEGPEKVLANLYSLVRQLPDWQNCAGIGAGVPGPCNQVTGSMSLDTNLPGFKGLPFAETLTRELGLPSFIDNDANVAGLAEALVGAGKGRNIVYYVTISTGIGGGLVIDGKCVSGRHGFTGEIANIIIDRDREKVNYLNAGAVENEASGLAIGRKARAAMPDQDIPHAGSVFEMAKAGNETAKKIADQAIGDLAQLFATLAAVVDPDIFVLGGGVMKSADYFMDDLIEKYKSLSHTALHDTEFALSQLEEPGVVGAAMLPK
ncbi:MAG: ROK family protein, partial [Erysipelotrichaceae bacterium]|nr:ROK family protein [Erysipelotrichaceae bacterium]